MQYAFAHDPCRTGDRVPNGAVPAGTQVQLLLRVDALAKGLVREAILQLIDGEEERLVPLEDCPQGFMASVDTSGDPRIVFYRFVISTDSGDIACCRREDGRSTACCVLSAEAAGECAPDSCFQLTVYDPSFKLPEWYAGCVMYQIFPDRFARGPEGILHEGVESHAGRGWPIHVHEDWNEQLDWVEPYEPVDFFGGTLSGIEAKLDYLASLGVGAIYLNPICEARSNHRYNTGDYQQVDPILGDWESFERLAIAAEKRGMRIILDTVLSHTGSSSRYFNLDGSYDSYGAAQGEGSPYRSWYDFEHGTQYAPYRCWWNDPTLPEVEEHDASWQRFMFGDDSQESSDDMHPRSDASSPRTNSRKDGASGFLGSFGFKRNSARAHGSSELPEGLLAQWIAHGAGGFRLDVADEIPDDVLEKIRLAAKAACPDSVIIGEVWEDPTTKESYGSRRTYALGKSLDSVMNYPLRAALLQFALGSMDAQHLETFLKTQRSNYPKPLYHGLMNLLSSHDVERVRSVLDLGMEFRDLPRPEQAALVEGISSEADEHGSKLQRLLACLLYMLPGSPCLYYGDERGMQGGRDPFDRATFPWDGWRPDCGRDLTGLYQALGKMRSASDVLKRGSVAFYSYGRDVSCILRMPDPSAIDADAVPSAKVDGTLLCVVNRSYEQVDFVIDLVEESSGLSKDEAIALRYSDSMPRCVLATDESGNLPEWDATMEDGIFRSTVGPMQACVFQLDAGLQKPLGKGMGVICHITSIPNADEQGNIIGPGTLGAPAKRFVDELARAGVRYWQILPLNPTDQYGSPYAGLSAFAGNTRLLEEGTLIDESAADTPEYAEFVVKNSKWLMPYATFVAIKEQQGGALWKDWPEELRHWNPKMADDSQLADAVRMECIRQFAFDRQWRELREYANSKGVRIVGDMPIYVSADSADAWAHREYLTLAEDGSLASQGGMPPDQFSAEGQLWGNPTYDWEVLRDNGYDWWLDRFERAFDWYDHVRIDHFLGFASYYSVPEGKNATEGEWLPGSGIDLFRRAYEKFGPLPVIVEDLGIITPQVKQLIAEAGFTGMDVLQFFDGDPREWWQPKPGKACFTSTHDTSTLIGWVKRRYCEDSDEREDEARAIAEELMARVLGSSADVVFMSLQDALGLDDSARMNTPGTAEGNWAWQASNPEISATIQQLLSKAP